MDVSESLELLKDHGAKVLWRYLDYLVYEQGSTNSLHHTRLAILAIEGLAAMRPEPDPRYTAATELKTIPSDTINDECPTSMLASSISSGGCR